MELSGLFDAMRDVVGVRRVFGEPVKRDGVTIVPAANVIGAGGGGGGEAPAGEEATAGATLPPGSTAPGVGGGMGYALIGWPAGAFEIRDGRTRWVPALDFSHILIAGLMLVALLLRARRD